MRQELRNMNKGRGGFVVPAGVILMGGSLWWKRLLVGPALPLALRARAAPVSLHQDGERSSVGVQPRRQRRRLYITDVSR